jgi:hypothetical protein
MREADAKARIQQEAIEHLRDELSAKNREKSGMESKLMNIEEVVFRLQRELNTTVADLELANKVLKIFYDIIDINEDFKVTRFFLTIH